MHGFAVAICLPLHIALLQCNLAAAFVARRCLVRHWLLESTLHYVGAAAHVGAAAQWFWEGVVALCWILNCRPTCCVVESNRLCFCAGWLR